ncbi:MAG: outer membrane beta-barrel protein [Lautropia sp.]
MKSKTSHRLPMIASVALCLICGVARADHPLSRAGLYVGASIGGAALDAGPIGRLEQSTPSAGAAGQLRVGYFFGPHWGIEGSYTRMNRLEQAYVDGVFRGSGHTIGLSGIGRLPFAQRWAVYAKATLASTRIGDDGSSGADTGFERLRGRSGSLLVGGLGVEYAVSDRLSVTLQTDALGRAGREANPSYTGLGLRWAF